MTTPKVWNHPNIYKASLALVEQIQNCDGEGQAIQKEAYDGVVPPNSQKLRGKPFHVNFFVDYDYAGDRATRKSQTRITLYCNSALIIWYSKKQNTVESSTFGAYFLAL